jgi:A118 family predicted phage portal protein
MPLPESSKDAKWPPPDVKPYIDAADRTAAWWSGDRTALATTSGAVGETRRQRFWQRKAVTGDKTKATAQLHAPLAGDIAAVSADLLFGDAVQLTHTNTDVQARLEDITETLGLENMFAEAAEIAAATGGVYLRPVWDTEFTDHPISRAHDQRSAVPDFRFGQLVAVTLWEELPGTDATVVFRHLERHEKGLILHGLYQGTKTELGTQIPLNNHPSTTDLEPAVVLGGRLAGRMLVSYVPNALPNRRGVKPIGRADWDGPAEDFLDALDETWTSMMRDIRLGQARIIVPDEWLKASGGRPGTAALLDIDTEAFVGLNIDGGIDKVLKPEMTQAALRISDHIDATLGLTERIVSAAGYSPQTFGLQIEGSAQSGTALRIREGKTDKTVSKKQRYWQPALAEHATTLLDIDAEIFSRPVDLGLDRVKVVWPELERDPAEQATWIQSLRTAQAMSIEQAVRAGQPHLDDDAVTEEVDRIRAENTVAAPDFSV